MKQLSSSEVAQLVKGELLGSSQNVSIVAVASLEDADGTQLSFLGNDKYAPQVKESKAGIVLIPSDYTIEDDKCYIKCDNPSAAFSLIIDHFAPEPVTFEPGVHPSAVVHPSATIADGAHIGPNAVISKDVKVGKNSVICAGVVISEKAEVGEDCLLHPNVTIRERCLIGNRCIIHSSTAIGSDGFGFIPRKGGHKKIPQVGIVVLEDDVEVGSCVTIDRARFGKTKIGTGTKIDNLVQIAHNVEIGAHCFIVSQSGIAGSTTLGNYVIMAAQAGIAGHLQVGDGVTMMGRAGVTKDISPGQTIFGFPAVPKKQYIKQNLRIKKIERLEKELAEIKKQLSELS
ncbi:MAG: UDP-3-O-(3-hydroxymyristoyl)glucosamine N-acyltransferase [Lentisphaeraceae bacterium]|nr:UDP-3-O-(3-hydroxymyristoyl)glucosamine N-acyltransferase [Lentisphaeraceae bacterium]